MRLTLSEAMTEVRNAVVGKLRAAKDGGALAGVETIVKGYRTRYAPILPKLHVVVTLGTNAHPPTTIKEQWTLELMLIGIVKHDDPEEGDAEALDIVCRARSVVLKERNLGLPGVVWDVRSNRVEPHPPTTDEKGWLLCAAAAVVEIKVSVHEPEEV